MPEGFRILDGFAVDITVSVLKIIKLYQNKRFTFDEAVEKLSAVEKIVMSPAPEGELGNLSRSSCSRNLHSLLPAGSILPVVLRKDIKVLVKKGRSDIDKDMETALETVSNIGAAVIDGASCCSKYVKDDIEQTTLFDEWLIECERMGEQWPP